MDKNIAFQTSTSQVSDTKIEMRNVNFVLGFGLIMVAMIDPPASMIWMAIANGLGILLVMLAILGKRIMPVMQSSRFLKEPRIITNTLGLLLGLGISILAIAYPPASTILAAYAHVVAIILIIQAIIGYNFLMSTGKSIGTGELLVTANIDEASNDATNTTRTAGTDLPKAA